MMRLVYYFIRPWSDIREKVIFAFVWERHTCTKSHYAPAFSIPKFSPEVYSRFCEDYCLGKVKLDRPGVGYLAGWLQAMIRGAMAA
jgi:hypothetical protein